MDVLGAIPKRMKVNEIFYKANVSCKEKLLKEGRKGEYETVICLKVSQKSQKIRERQLMP